MENLNNSSEVRAHEFNRILSREDFFATRTTPSFSLRSNKRKQSIINSRSSMQSYDKSLNNKIVCVLCLFFF